MLNTIQRGRLRDLKQNLIETDYKIIKCYEASLIGEALPYNINELIQQRNQWRVEINELENLL
jgi:hypothetical protein